MKRALVLLLCLAGLAGLLTGCAGFAGALLREAEPEELRAAIEAELACEIRGDEAGSYRLFYPEAVDPETFHQVFTQSQSYFPIREGYTLTMQEFDSYRGLRTEESHTTAWYLVETGGKSYYLFVRLVSDEGGTGFQQWNVLNEADYQAWLEEGNQ